MYLKRKLIVGLAQLTSEYAKFNKKRISFDELKKIFRYLKKEKINTFDTAIDYKNVDKKFSKINNRYENLKIITKFSIPKYNDKRYLKLTIDKLKKSLKKFKLKKFEAVLIHNPWCLNKSNFRLVNKIINDIKRLNISKKVGVSVYNLEEYNNFRKFFIPKVTQIPFNIFNTQFNNKDFINDIKKNNIEVHARSIFLKGLLVKSNIMKIKLQNNMANNLLKFEQYLKKKNYLKLEFLINFILSHKFINKLVIGFGSKKEVEEFLKIRIKKINVDGLKFNLRKNEFDPRLWKN